MRKALICFAMFVIIDGPTAINAQGALLQVFLLVQGSVESMHPSGHFCVQKSRLCKDCLENLIEDCFQPCLFSSMHIQYIHVCLILSCFFFKFTIWSLRFPVCGGDASTVIYFLCSYLEPTPSQGMIRCTFHLASMLGGTHSFTKEHHLLYGLG